MLLSSEILLKCYYRIELCKSLFFFSVYVINNYHMVTPSDSSKPCGDICVDIGFSVQYKPKFYVSMTDEYRGAMECLSIKIKPLILVRILMDCDYSLLSSHQRSNLGRAVAQAVSRWLPTAAARVCVLAACEICGGQSGTGVGFLRVLRFPLPIIIPPICPSS
jgi:hypothetical protein